MADYEYDKEAAKVALQTNPLLKEVLDEMEQAEITRFRSASDTKDMIAANVALKVLEKLKSTIGQ